jgi:hypothetical protein
MSAPQDDSGALKTASYAAYNEAVIAAFRTLSASITEYFEERHELYANEFLEVPRNFRPLGDYERTLRVQRLTLRLALQTAEMLERNITNGAGPPVPMNGSGDDAHQPAGMAS